jgi:hypothetical protein
MLVVPSEKLYLDCNADERAFYAVDEAKEIRETHGLLERPPLLLAAKRQDKIDEIRALGDHDNIAHTLDPLVRYPTEVLADSQTEIIRGFETCLAEWGIAEATQSDQYRIRMERFKDSITNHEVDHLDRARQLGFTTLFYAFTVFISTKGVVYTPFVRCTDPQGTVTKLENASIYIAPPDPSSNDIEYIQSIGYQDKADILHRLDAVQNR